MDYFLLPCLGSGSAHLAPRSKRLLFPWDPMLLAAALGIRAALILSPSKVGIVSSDSCVCHYIGLRLFISCSFWFGSVHETRFVTKQERTDM